MSFQTKRIIPAVTANQAGFPVLALTLSLMLAGCEKAKPGGGGTTPLTVPLMSAGEWNGPFSSSLLPERPSEFTITQGGSTVQGTYIAGEREGRVTGYVYANILYFSLSQDLPCVGTLTGTAELDANKRLLMRFEGTDCSGTHANGTILLTGPLPPPGV